MVKITKREAEIIRNKYPDVHIRVVGKFAPARKKSRYVAELKRVMTLLKGIRESEGLDWVQK